MKKSSLNLPRRPRRLRQSPWLRELVAEHRLHPSDLIWPVFIASGSTAEPIASMPGVFRLPIAQLVEEAKKAAALGIPAIALFPATPPEHKSDDGSEAFNPDNLVCQAVRALKAAVPEIGVICDVALDPYTSHGQDGLLQDGVILNDETVEALCKQAITLAEAGCDMVAPSDMMDGRVGAIRAALDEAGYAHTPILSYTAKYASAFYGPFRDAVGSANALGTADKRTYQMDFRNSREALTEAALDDIEGADALMVKPGMPYLDVVRTLSEYSELPVFAYQVSGEYAMLKAGAATAGMNERALVLESLIAFKRAGARGILTYFAPVVAQWLTEK
jgi:porphobilinogen synthase